MFLDSDGVTEIFAKDLGDVIAGSAFAKKFFLQNDLGRVSGAITGTVLQFGTDELYSRVRWAICPDTLSCPFNVTATLISGGALDAGEEYYYRVTAYNENGETGGSLEVSAATDSSNRAVTLSWSAVPGASGYIVYRSTNQLYINARRTIIENPMILSWTDTGQAADVSSAYGWPGINADFDLPSENTTAGETPDYGTAPALSSGTLSIGVLQIGQQVAIWRGLVTDASMPETLENYMLSFSEA